MGSTLTAQCDRAGHGQWRTVLLLFACLVAPAGAAASGPGAYTARRFDVNARALAGGSLEITETIAFDFQSGTFEKVWREIPSSRTDGIDIVEASMDGKPVTRGKGPGHFLLSGSNRIRVEWQFAPTGPSSHTFELRYIARGVAYQEDGRDVVRWRLLPAEHRYTIGESRNTISGPVKPEGPAALETRHAGEVSNGLSGDGVQIVARGIERNGWMIAEVRYPAGSLVSTPPAWQQRQLGAAALAPRWLMGAGAILIAGIMLVLLTFQAYPSPGFTPDGSTVTSPPQRLPAALASALAAKGRASGFQSVATLLDLADRGVLTVRELPRRLGVRNYELAQVPGKHDLDDHEAAALTIAFAGSGDEVTMSRARGRLARGARGFARVVNGDLAERGFLDPARQSARDRLTAVSLAMLFAAGMGAVGAAFLIPRYEGFPFLLPLALALGGIIGGIMTAATTNLSDTGLIEGARWRGFRRHLKGLAAARDDGGAAAVGSRWIVYGIALGLATQWARYLKRHPDAAPSWFVAGASDDAGGAFAAFVGSHAVNTGGAGAGGGAAAGGGGSGAG